uniref:Uncharacterized protein n=1 Tax=Branchiostoma floridae TaxID=7739 RepID=C3ZJX4_BRAFL|eukprot:XP_002591130.1 hypothetical protein BRAFLDRAFT_105526 [Branchiostoma floridae]
MEQGKALVGLSVLLLSSHFLSVLADVPSCPGTCRTQSNLRVLQALGWGLERLYLVCYCPDENGKKSHCSWIGHEGTYSFPVCLDTIPTGFHKATSSIFIKHLRSPISMKRSFPNISELPVLHITASNVSSIQPGAFQGLPLVKSLHLYDNRISSLEPGTFLGLNSLKDLYINKNEISSISKYAFRGLPLLAFLSLAQNRLQTVPVGALLQPQALTVANLNTNYITTIDIAVLLKQNQHIHLTMEGNRLNCDTNQTRLVCSIPDHVTLCDLMCSSPSELRRTLLVTLRKDFIETGKCDIKNTSPTLTSTAGIANVTAVTKTTNRYMSVIHILEEDAIISKDGKHYLFAMIAAAVVPIFIVSALTVICITIKRFYGGATCPCQNTPSGADQGDSYEDVSTANSAANGQPNSAHDGTIQPYAVAYADVPEKGERATTHSRHRLPDKASSGDEHTIQPYAVAHADVAGKKERAGKHSGQQLTDQASEDDDTIQPYAVSYMDVSCKGENGRLPPYATTTLAHDDQASKDDDTIQPYAVSYMDVSCKGENGRLPPYATTTLTHDDQTSKDEDTIQPYAVSYMDVSCKGENGRLPPYATTTLAHDDQASKDDDTIQPYAVSYMDVSCKGKNGRLPPYATTTLAHDQSFRDKDTVQPYAVSYVDVSCKCENGKLAPYATTTLAHD